MLKWILILIIIVIALGYFRNKRAKQEEEKHTDKFERCRSGCAGCASRSLCSENENEEKK